MIPPGIYIYDYVRTAIGRAGGALAKARPDDLAAATIESLVARTGLDTAAIDDVILGCANQAGEDCRDVARMAGLLAGLPVEVPGQTVNRLCASGLQAIVSAAHAIRSGEGELFLGGGVESMTRAPLAMPKASRPFQRGRVAAEDTALGWRFVNPRMPDEHLASLGETAENVARRYAISRADQDEWAVRSHERAIAARKNGRMAEEIVVTEAEGLTKPLQLDEGPRADTSTEALGALRPAFDQDGTVTAGNASPLSDGAALLAVGNEAAGEAHGLRPLARLAGAAVVGVQPEVMGIGPIPAVTLLLDRSGLAVDDIELVEINEAFASQVLASIRELALDAERVNPNGGAVAVGHPLGCSGARLTGTLAIELRERGARYGIATLCVGVGQGMAVLLENPEA